MMNPFVGGIFSLVWGIAVVVDAARSGEFARRIARHAMAAVPVALALGWCAWNQMVEGGGSALQFGLSRRRAQHDGREPDALARTRHRRGVGGSAGLAAVVPPPTSPVVSAFRRNIPALLLAVVSLGLLYFVRLDVDTSWVGFRAGQMFLVAVPVLIARGLASSGIWQRVAIGHGGGRAPRRRADHRIDVYNAQDVTNFSESPIGPWTVAVTANEHAGLDWLRTTTPATAIVQMDPTARGRTTWSLIPSFAQRRMAAGQPISLLGGTAAGH